MNFRILIAISLLYISCNNNPSTIAIASNEDNEYNSDGMEEDLKGRDEWMKNMLANPSTGEIPKGIRNMEMAFANQLPQCNVALNKTNNMGFWSQRGPYNIGGRTRAIAIDKTNENILLAGGASGGIWRSYDAGASWYICTNIDSNVNVTCITQDVRKGKENIFKYSYDQYVIQANDLNSNFKILNYNYEKNIDLMKSLRVGMYVNKTYFYDLYSNSLDVYKYTLKDQVKNKLGAAESIVVSDEFGDSVTRIMVKVADRGILNPDGSVSDKLRSGADMAMSYSRYNLLFSQAININVPMNINLKCGDIIYVQFPKMEPANTGEVDPEQSGFYLINNLRHHFDPTNKMLTSMRLVRDSYGLYGPKNL